MKFVNNSSFLSASTLAHRLPIIFVEVGSLKDVLENEAIQLDWNFRMSLIHDIVKVSIGYSHAFEEVQKAYAEIRYLKFFLRFILFVLME